MTKEERLKNANEFIKVIASCGRNFFYTNKGHTARLEVSATGRVFFIDQYSLKRIYTHQKYGGWDGFTSGGTMESLVRAMRDFITKGKQMRANYFNENKGEVFGNPWGYGKDILIVREAAVKLGLAH